MTDPDDVTTSMSNRYGPRLDDPTLRAYGILPAHDAPPFDIVGDVHGCATELRTLLSRLGYTPDGAVGDGYRHPAGRRVIFVGDLVDRGPAIVETLRIALAMTRSGAALNALGNHDEKFLRWLRGRPVQLTYGLDRTVEQMWRLPASGREAFEREVEQFFARTPSYLLLDGGRLVVTHGCIFDAMIGRWSERIAEVCAYGDLEHTPDGRTIRRDWARRRDLPRLGDEPPRIVYGHVVTPELRWVNLTLDIDTGCVYGGRLTALRYPELELVEVPAERAYAKRGA